jgi:hypothetical protein
VSDLERVKEFYDWLKEPYELVNNHEDEQFYGGYAESSHKDFNQKLYVGTKGDWYWHVYLFQDGELYTHYLTE